MLLAGLTNSAPLSTLSASGLDLVIDGIDGVIATIDHEQDSIKPDVFRQQGAINPASFGGADSAPRIALHHTRAHEVIGNTLDAIKQDLAAFRQACIDAKNAIVTADEESAARMVAAQRAVESLESGAKTAKSDRAYERAQQDQDVTGGVDL